MSSAPVVRPSAHVVTLIPGDGVGPEVVQATRRIIAAAGVQIQWEERDAGASVFKRGLPSGVPPETIESIRKTRVVLKGPLETPVGFGEKSANVTLRKLFETFGNIRPVRELPGVPTPFSGRGIDLVVVRENVEDLYAGIEHMQTPGVAQCLKLISRKGCEKVVRLAFEVAVSEGRKKVHCATKANIMKLSEGLLKRTFEEIAKEYPQIQAQHIIVDNCAHQLVRFPELFDVLVTTNMNGDILSDLTSGLIGGLGFAPSANLGNGIAIFEAVHGSAPKYAGQNKINPTAVLLSSVMLLRHLGEFEAAAAIEHAVLVTLEEGKVRTFDMLGPDGGDRERMAASTTAYTDAIIANLGKKSSRWLVRDYTPLKIPQLSTAPDFVKAKTHRYVGVDLFLQSGETPEAIGKRVEALCEGTALKLAMVANRGTAVYPPTGTSTDSVDHWVCRFLMRDTAAELSDGQLIELLGRISSTHRWMHLEKLSELDGAPGYTKAQGQN
jgi:isocitrate dehydrogenase